MGLNFIRDQAEKFRQQRDAAHEAELSTPDLLTRLRSNVFIPHFNCKLTDNATEVKPGLILVGRAFSESDVRLMQRGKYIGGLLPDDAERLSNLMRKNALAGFISLRIESSPGIDGIFRVAPKKPFAKM